MSMATITPQPQPQPQPQVQHVTKASSDQLLSKFAEMDSESPPPPTTKSSRKRELQIVKKSKRSRLDRNDENCGSPLSGGIVERRSLIPRSTRKCSVLREIGVRGTSKIRAREPRNKSLLGAIEKTWRKTIEGASKIFMENHYNRHKRLINDVV